ncbi:Acid phosphatase [Aphelenchoides fujianensis]|nr:Acid phosphatase [Aphelenchoides fujianensis]
MRTQRLAASILLLVLAFIVPLNQCGRVKKVGTAEMRRAPPISNADDGQLVFTQLVWRHGDRSPIHHFPKDKVPVSHWTQGGGGLGQLTTDGMKQHVELGQKLRARYDNFVDKRYKNGEIYVHSTDINRTIISAISNMIGFYSAGVAGEDYPSGLTGWPGAFVPVPIHSSVLETDYVLGCPDHTKHADDVYAKLHSTKEYTDAEAANKDLLDKLAGLIGYKTLQLSFITAVYDTFFIQKIKRLQWPDGVDEALFNKTRELAGFVDDLEDGIGVADQEGIDFSVEMAKINGGSLLTDIIDHMQYKVHCLETKGERSKDEHAMCAFFDRLKYYAYSAHDTTIGALFSTFGFKTTDYNETGLPHYAAAAAVELLQAKGADNKNVYNIRLVYWPGYEDALQGEVDLTSAVTGCEQGCTLDQFVARSKNFTDSDFVKYCDGTTSKGAAGHLSTATIFFISFAFVAEWVLGKNTQ